MNIRTQFIAFHSLRMWACLTAVVVLPSLKASAQTFETVGNQYVTANVVTDSRSGRFWITAGPKFGGVKFLYQTGDLITSNVVFKISRNGIDNYYCNVPTSGAIASWRPQIPGKPGGASYKQYDSMYVAPDTLAIIWKNMDGYTVIMRFIPEKRATIYDDATDMLIEFEYHLSIFAPYAEIGVLLMLDTFNSDANAFSGGGVGGGDRSSIMTNLKYYAAGGPGGVFSQPYDSIPEFYQVGNFLYQLSNAGLLNMVLPIHRLRGYSHAGAPLTTPNMFVIGDWKSFRLVGWDPPSSAGATPFEDCATILRWEKRYGDGVIRTAFGTDDRGGNSIFHCRDSVKTTKTSGPTTFVNIRTARLVTQAVKNGPYTPQQFDAEAWIANTDDAFAITTVVRLVTPIRSFPNNTGRLLLDPSTPASYSVSLGPHEVKKVVWRLNVNPNSTDTLAQLSLRYKFGTGAERAFRSDCNPLVTIKGYKDPVPPTPPDTIAPVIQRTGSGLVPSAFWLFRSFDRHTGYKYDTGIDQIITEANDGSNFTLTWMPASFNRCDTTVTLNMQATVVDTTKPARIVFAVYDCYGNISRDSAIYAPRPDIFKPEISRVDSAGALGAPCNTRVYSVYLLDSIHQTPQAGDYGFGSVQGLLFNNFNPLEINFDRGGTPISDYDPSASFRLSVIDSMSDGSATIRFADIAGNADTATFTYCTQPDDKAPRFSTMKIDNENWIVDGSDTLAWDRGLEAVQVLSNMNGNMTFTPPVIIPGQRTMGPVNVSVIDNAKDAQIVLELQDTVYKSNPAGHADTLTLRFAKIPDERAPNIIFSPVDAYNDALADVEVNDIHYDSGVRYKYDLGLATVRVSAQSPNFRLSLPINFATADTVTTFQVQVIDTLALNKQDSICIEATDLAGNKSVNCYYYPLVPDHLSPILSASVDNARTRLNGQVTDVRGYDRGLGSVVLNNAVNIDVAGLPFSLIGAYASTINAGIIDPKQPFSGTIVLRDRIAVIDSSPSVLAVHETRIPFALPALHLALKLPPIVQSGESLNAALVIANDSVKQPGKPPVMSTVFTSADVDSVTMTLHYSGIAHYTGFVPNSSLRIDAATGGDLSLSWTPQPLRVYKNGDTLAMLTFATDRNPNVELFSISLLPNSAMVNGGRGRTITTQKPGDSLASVLSLPTPYMGIAPDSLTYVNGYCQSVLTGGRKALKPNAIAILGLRPQPLSPKGGSTLELDIRNLPAAGARVELMNALGQTVATVQIRPAIVTGDLTRTRVELPSALPSGIYFLRITGGEASDWAKMVVAE